MPDDRKSAKALDKFYTRPPVVDLCLNLLQETARERGWATALTVEPSAGSGAFLRAITGPKIGLDIAPEGPGIERADFLTWTPPETRGPVWVIGNPPFGKNSSLALRFVNHAARFADVIAFVLPRTFEKPSLQRRIDRRLHLAAQTVLPEDAFTLCGEPLRVPCVFQIWERRADERALPARALTHPDFEFVPLEGAHFAVQRVGVMAGAVKDRPSSRSSSSHHGVRATGRVPPDELMTRFEALDYASVKHRTAGNPSVGKGEVVDLYRAAFPLA